MKKTVRLLKPAQQELDDAYAYYQQQYDGLGIECINEIKSTINRIRNNPKAWSPFSSHTRRCLVHRFPYGIIYQIRENHILIIAIAHLHRKPGYWIKRLNRSLRSLWKD